MVLSFYGIDNTSEQYNEKYDFNGDGQIQALDYAVTLNNYSKTREIQ